MATRWFLLFFKRLIRCKCYNNTIFGGNVSRKVSEKIDLLREDSLFLDGILLVLSGLIAGGLNYLFQILMGRLLNPSQYGIFGSLFGLSYVFMTLSIGVGYCSMKYISSLSGDELSSFMSGFAFRVGSLGVVGFILILLATPAIAGFLQIANDALILFIGTTYLLGIVNYMNTGSVKGFQKFNLMAKMEVVEAFLKVVFGVCLVLLGFGVYGAIGGIVLSIGIVASYYAWYLRRWYLGKGNFGSFSSVYRYGISSVLVAFCFNFPTNIDIILVKHIFTSTQTGLYTSITVLGKILIFLPQGITASLFPKVSESQSKGDLSSDLLNRALLYTNILVSGVVILYILFPQLIVQLFFGASYINSAFLLPWYGVTMWVFANNTIFIHYHLASDQLLFIKSFVLITILQIGSIYLLGSELLTVVQILLAGNTIALLIAIVFYLRNPQSTY